MISTVSFIELNEIINAVHGDPHKILGMHEIDMEGKKIITVRAFIPQAKKIILIDPNDETFSCEIEKIHVDGFFESIIPEKTEWFRYKFKIEDYTGNEWETYDPYSFQPQISELDMYLFGEGTHYNIFEKLGAHLKTVDKIQGASFAVWAPNAIRVSVIGEFNNWDGRRGQMRTLGKSGIWEIFIPGMQQCDGYKFEIRTYRGELIQKSDPYANFVELRPSSTSLVFDLDNHKWKDSKWIKKRMKNNPLEGPMNIYEVHLGSWKLNEDGSFLSYSELAEQLIPYVKKMGYTHIEIMPISEYPYDGSWGYQVTGYYAPTSRYGNPEEFMQFVEMCHQNDIGIILDWVPAHFPKDAHGLAKFDGAPLYEYADPRKGEHPEWGTLIFNYGCKEVKNFLIANAIFWIEKFHIDGLRVDAVASMLYLNYGKNDGQWIANQYGGKENLEAVEFMKHMNSIVLKRNPNVLMIAEESTSWAGVSHPVEEGGLGFNLKWNMGWMNDFLEYIQKETMYRKYHHNNLTFGMVYAYTENFIQVLSHDEVVHGKKSMIDKMPGDLWQKCANLKTAYSYMYGQPGKKLLFMGGEFGQFIEWDEKHSLNWFLLEIDHHKQIKNYMHDLNNLYKNERAFWFDDFKGNGFEWINCNDSDRSILSFIRKSNKPEETLVFVFNFTPNMVEEYEIGVPFAGFYKEILNSDSDKYGGSGIVNDLMLKAELLECDKRDYSIRLRIPPLGTVILKPDKLNLEEVKISKIK